jgi:hypothetical protein
VIKSPKLRKILNRVDALERNDMEKKKRINLMRYWLFGVFIIFFTAITLYIGVALGLGLMIFQLPAYWLVMGMIAIFCMMTNSLYKIYLTQNAL